MTLTISALEARVAEILDAAALAGWQAEAVPVDVEGCAAATQIVAVLEVGLDDDAGSSMMFGFATALGARLGTRRVSALEISDAGASARVVVTLEDGSGRWWHSSRVSSWREALADPVGWCHLDDEAGR